MLRQLRIWNLVLIEFAEIPFKKGFNVLSGETGAGKSALMHALSLITGDRADLSLLRKGADKGIVEAQFDIDDISFISTVLHENEIYWERGCELCIRREIHATGRSRTFINDQLVQLSLLRQISLVLFDIIGQHANQQLLDEDQHRKLVDLFGNIESEAQAFASSWSEENAQRVQLQTYIQGKTQRLRDIETCHREIAELQKAQLKEGEEDELFAEYSRLNHAQELIHKVQDIHSVLSSNNQPILSVLNRQRNVLTQLIQFDPTLEETAQDFENVILELQEISHTLGQYLTQLEYNPNRLEFVNERLTVIDRTKKRYGNCIEEVQAYEQQVRTRLAHLQSIDEEIENIQENLALLSNKNDGFARKLTESRQEASKQLSEAIEQELRSLNMPKVEFYCRLTSKTRSASGDDCIEFFLQPNVGEHQVPVKECASGGELSRLMLALQVIMAGKKHIPTLIFDEIDANIGGETASIVGEKLLRIGQQHQVLCITHFPQVAKRAEHHLCIAKEEQNGRTFTQVSLLDAKMRTKELNRMAGLTG